MPSKQSSSSGDVLGFKSDVFTQIIKWGAIAGAIAGAIVYFGTFLGTMFSWFGLVAAAFGSSFSSFSVYALVKEIIETAIYGIVTAIIAVKFYDKIPFKTLFMKIFGVALVITLVIWFIFGAFILIFAGPITFVIDLAAIVIADFVMAKLISKNVGPLVGLQ